VIIMPTGPMPLDHIGELPSPEEQQQHETDMATTAAQAHAQAAAANGANSNGKKPVPKDKPLPKTTKTLRRSGDIFKGIDGRTYIEVDGWIVPQDVL